MAKGKYFYINGVGIAEDLKDEDHDAIVAIAFRQADLNSAYTQLNSIEDVKRMIRVKQQDVERIFHAMGYDTFIVRHRVEESSELVKTFNIRNWKIIYENRLAGWQESLLRLKKELPKEFGHIRIVDG